MTHHVLLMVQSSKPSGLRICRVFFRPNLFGVRFFSELFRSSCDLKGVNEDDYKGTCSADLETACAAFYMRSESESKGLTAGEFGRYA